MLCIELSGLVLLLGAGVHLGEYFLTIGAKSSIALSACLAARALAPCQSPGSRSKPEKYPLLNLRLVSIEPKDMTDGFTCSIYCTLLHILLPPSINMCGTSFLAGK